MPPTNRRPYRPVTSVASRYDGDDGPVERGKVGGDHRGRRFPARRFANISPEIAQAADQHDERDDGERRAGDEEVRHPEVSTSRSWLAAILPHGTLRANGAAFPAALDCGGDGGAPIGHRQVRDSRARARHPHAQRRSGARLDAAQADAAGSGLKAMIPVGRPFLDYVLSALADAGFTRACLVIGPEHGVVRDHYAGRAASVADRRRLRRPGPGAGHGRRAARRRSLRRRRTSSRRSTATTTTRSKRSGSSAPSARPGTVLFDADALVRESNIPAGARQGFRVRGGRRGWLHDGSDREATGASVPRARGSISMNCWRFDSGDLPGVPRRAALASWRARAAARREAGDRARR